MGKSPKRAAAPDPQHGVKPPSTWEGARTSTPWFTAKQRRRCGRFLVWSLGPLLGAAAIAFINAPEAPARPTPVKAKAADGLKSTGSADTLEAPPADTWANPSECQAWAGSGQVRAQGTGVSESCAPPDPRAVDPRGWRTHMPALQRVTACALGMPVVDDPACPRRSARRIPASCSSIAPSAARSLTTHATVTTSAARDRSTIRTRFCPGR